MAGEPRVFSLGLRPAPPRPGRRYGWCAPPRAAPSAARGQGVPGPAARPAGPWLVRPAPSPPPRALLRAPHRQIQSPGLDTRGDGSRAFHERRRRQQADSAQRVADERAEVRATDSQSRRARELCQKRVVRYASELVLSGGEAGWRREGNLVTAVGAPMLSAQGKARLARGEYLARWRVRAEPGAVLAEIRFEVFCPSTRARIQAVSGLLSERWSEIEIGPFVVEPEEELVEYRVTSASSSVQRGLTLDTIEFEAVG